MSDAAEHQPPHDDGPEPSAPDPLAGDWSEGLPGPLHASGLEPPRLLDLAARPLDGSPPAADAPPEPAAPSATEEAVPAQNLDAAPATAEWAAVPPSEEHLPPPTEPLPLPPVHASAVAPASADGAEEVVAEESIDIDVSDQSIEIDPPERSPDIAAAEESIDIDTDDLAAPPSPATAPTAPAEDAPTPWSEPVDVAAPEHAPAENTTAWMSPPTATREPAESWASTAPRPPTAPIVVAAPPIVEAAPPVLLASAPEAPVAPAPPAVEEAWNAVPAAAPVEDWRAEDASGEWQKPSAPESATPAGIGTDWSSLSSGPDWAGSDDAPAQPAVVAEAWSASGPDSQSPWNAAAPSAPSAAMNVAWDAPAAAGEAANDDWVAPPAGPQAVESWDASAPPPAKPAWNSPGAGASALEQLASEAPSAEPGAAAALFAPLPQGVSLSSEDDGAQAPAVLADEDANLLVPLDEAPKRVARLAAVQPVSIGALHVPGNHRVAVHMRGGRTRRGSVSDVDLSKSSFVLSPQGGGDAETVYHGEVKAVFFMLAPGEKPKKADGRKVRITFTDGRSIDGHRDGAEAKQGFFLVPSDAARTNTSRIYVAREALSDVKDG